MAMHHKALIEREPLRPISDEQKRYLIVTPQIDALLDGYAMFGIFPTHATETLIGVFCAGQRVRVSRKKTDEKPDLERLEGEDEVWALCPRVPKPGWRILGRFYEPNVLIGLRAWPKGDLFGKYQEAAQEVIDDWNELFPAHAPHGGQEVGDYICQVFRDVDDNA